MIQTYMLKLLTIRTLLSVRYRIIACAQKLLFSSKMPVSKILIHRIGTFGDSIVTLPALSIIRRHYPHAQLDFVTTYATPLNLSTIVRKDFFSKIYLIQKQNRKKELKALKHEHYDLYIELPQNYGLIKTLRNMLVVRFLLGIKNAFGWDEGMSKLFAKEQLTYAPPLRESERFIRNLARNAITGTPDYPLQIEAPSAELLTLFQTPHKVVAFVIGTNVPANKWPLSSWRSLAVALCKEGFSVAVIGGEQEKQDAHKIIADLDRAYTFCGQFSIAQSAGFLQTCTAAICHDTGAMHLCYAVHTPLVALFSSRQLASKWFPPEKGNAVLMQILSCSGCFRKQCENNLCLKEITPDAVERQLHELLKEIDENSPCRKL